MTHNDEQGWITAARRGDRSAFGRLVQAYQVPVYNLTYRMLGNAAEAEEAAQETFLKAYTKLDTYQPDRKFSNWILSIASHHCIDRLRRRRFIWLSVEDTPSVSWLASGEESPEDAALRSERADQVRVMLERLEPGYRAPVVLRYWYDLSCKEIAQILELSESAVKSRLHRARLQLASLLEEQSAPAGQSSRVQDGSGTAAATDRSRKSGGRRAFWLGLSADMARG